jgi:hypothetical protein
MRAHVIPRTLDYLAHLIKKVGGGGEEESLEGQVTIRIKEVVHVPVSSSRVKQPCLDLRCAKQKNVKIDP